MSLPLTKCLDPEYDYAELAEELKVVGRWFYMAKEQHTHRRFEYALALRAYDTWAQRDYEYWGHANRTHGGRVVDVGGAGSPFKHMISEAWGGTPTIVDPEENHTLAQHVRYAGLASCVFCLSVLEHVDDLDQFCYHLSCLVAPGGLLFLTMDCCGCPEHPEPEAHHFHWMRKRIFTTNQRLNLAFSLKDFQLLGEADRLYHGDHVYDYSFASLALVKRP
jgi:hypothetical protein